MMAASGCGAWGAAAPIVVNLALDARLRLGVRVREGGERFGRPGQVGHLDALLDRGPDCLVLTRLIGS